MRFLTALDKLVDDQYRLTSKWYPDMTRDEFANEPCVQLEIASEVGHRIAKEFGELVDWGTFENCREWGLTVSTAGGWTFCFYEHRNSDSICIEGCPTSEIRPYGPYGLEDKHDTLSNSQFERYDEVAKTLSVMIRLTVGSASTTRSDLQVVGRAFAVSANY